MLIHNVQIKCWNLFTFGWKHYRILCLIHWVWLSIDMLVIDAENGITNQSSNSARVWFFHISIMPLEMHESSYLLNSNAGSAILHCLEISLGRKITKFAHNLEISLEILRETVTYFYFQFFGKMWLILHKP